MHACPNYLSKLVTTTPPCAYLVLDSSSSGFCDNCYPRIGSPVVLVFLTYDRPDIEPLCKTSVYIFFVMNYKLRITNTQHYVLTIVNHHFLLLFI